MIAVRPLMVLACAFALPVMAQTTAATPAQPATTARADVPAATPAVTADTDQDVKNPRAMPLSLDEAIRTSLKANLGVELQRYDFSETAQNLRGAYSIFDIYTAAQLNKSTSKSPTLRSIDASSSGNTSVNAQAQQTLPTGGSYTIGTTNSRSKTSGGTDLFNPSYSSGLDFGFTQPLARDFGVDITRRNINIARNTLGISRELFRTALLDTTNAVEQAYLDLIYTRQYIDVVRESLFLARDQARITQIRIDVGASAPLDILQPRVQIATSEEALISAVADVRSAEDRLRQLMNLPPEEWDRPIIPTSNVGFTPTSIDVAGSIARAYELRPEIKENQLTSANRRITYQYARNQVLPQFDLVAGYNVAGVGGRSVDPTNATSTRFQNAVRQVIANDFPGWNVGVNIGVPIFNIGARAEARRAELDVERYKVVEEQTRQNVAVDVRSTARAIDTAAKEIGASRTAREAAEQNLDAERKRYENGMTTNFQVLQIQQQLSDARARELQALVTYNKALAAFHRSVGDLLEIRNIAVEEPAGIEEPGMFSRFSKYNWLNYEAHDSKEKID
jgi:HAE1 family hydrophobic/amphiphilic exporter-1